MSAAHSDSPSTILNDGGHPQAQGRVEGAPKTSGAVGSPAAAPGALNEPESLNEVRRAGNLPPAYPTRRTFRINRRGGNSKRVVAEHVRFEPAHVVFTATNPDGSEFIVEAILNSAIKDLIEVPTQDE